MATPLLNEDGTASMATALMCSHHAFLRDLRCFAEALAGDLARSEALSVEWRRFREGLHHHHTSEDMGIFPNLRAKGGALAAEIDLLSAQHRAIDPLLEQGDRLFAEPRANAEDARELVSGLEALLDEHLAAEEKTVIPHLRAAKEFPLPPTEDVVAMYADGFAWASAGLAETVLEKLFVMLPPALAARMPAARAAFEERCRGVWGRPHAGSSVTSVPELKRH